jgi:hypothetical protein
MNLTESKLIGAGSTIFRVAVSGAYLIETYELLIIIN